MSSLYGWSVLSTTNPALRLYRLFLVFIGYLSLKFGYVSLHLLPNTLQKILNQYQQANTILFVGGGYFRSSKGVKQSLNLFMQLAPFLFANLFQSKKIVCPISFGPFAYAWQEKMTASIFTDYTLISTREHISYAVLKKYGIKNLILSTDHALLLNVNQRTQSRKKNKYLIIGITVRNWGSRTKQYRFENELAHALYTVSHIMNIKILPIIQVDAPEYGDNDSEVTERIIKQLKKKNMSVLPLRVNKSLKYAIETYSRIDLLIGMRMHSNILSAIQYKPFIGIAYEHKTKGIAEQLGMNDFVIELSQIEKIPSLVLKVGKSYQTIKKTLKERLESLRRDEIYRWKILLKV